MLLPGRTYIVGDPGTSRIFATFFRQIQVKTKKSFPLQAQAPGTVPYGKYGPGYCITLIQTLDEGLS